MKAAFYLPDATSLRYYIPLIRSLIERSCFDEYYVFYTRRNVKYNGLYHANVFDACVRAMQLYIPSAVMIDVDADIHCSTECDALFTIECGTWLDTFSFGTHFAIQHGVDARLGLSKHSHKRTIYLVTSPIYIDGCDVRYEVVSPISCWLHDSYVLASNASYVCVFYPENGLNEYVITLCDMIADTFGLGVVIKQRSKSQRVPATNHTVMYDTVWYPSESIVVPLRSLVTVGFGTSAYTDLAHCGVPFVDVTVTDYSVLYPKPKLDNFLSIDCVKHNVLLHNISALFQRSHDACAQSISLHPTIDESIAMIMNHVT